MNSFNSKTNLLSQEGRKNNTESERASSSSERLHDRILAELSEPLVRNWATRPRKPLSKFTIASPPPPSCPPDSSIPAYRTVARESLPVISPEDKKRMNIFSYTGLPEYASDCPKSTEFTSTGPSGSHLKTRKLLLKSKTIHRSLEDLRHSKTRFDRFAQAKPAKCVIPILPKNSEMLTKRSVSPRKNDDRIKISPSISCTTSHSGKVNSEAQTDNIINTGENNETNSGNGNGGRGDCTHIIPGSSRENFFNEYHEDISDKQVTSVDHEDENFAKLSLENSLLKQQIVEERRKCILYRIISAFAFEALKRRSQKLSEVEENVQNRRVECAARIVLHHLLLNSWRMTKGQVTAIMVENTQMHKTIDNQSLQLNIIRKMQSMEKEKTTSILKEYAQVKRDYSETIKENEAMKEEYAKVLEEKNSLQRHLRSLSDENVRLNSDLQLRLDKKDMQLKSMELDRLQAEKFTRENEQLARDSEIAKSKISELTAQQANWQERAMSFESKCFELKLEMERREILYKKVSTEKGDTAKENEILTLSKLKLEKAVEEAQVKLVQSITRRKELEKSYNECREELEDLEDQVQYLQSALRQYKRENVEIRQKLYDCTLKNVQKRRVWGAALYFLVNPIEAFKRFYFGVPERPVHHHSSREARPERLSVTGRRYDESLNE